MDISEIFCFCISRYKCWCSLNHSSIQPTNRSRIALAFNRILLSSYVIGIYRNRKKRVDNPPAMSRRIRYTFAIHVVFSLFFNSLIVLPIIVTANTLTELSWLDMDVWWDIGNCDMLARRARIP